MSLSGLCSIVRAHEVGPVPVFVSEENPGALALSPYSDERREVAGLFVCTAMPPCGEARLSNLATPAPPQARYRQVWTDVNF